MHVHRMSDTAETSTGLSDEQFQEIRRLLLPGHELSTMMLADYKASKGITGPSDEEREAAEHEPVDDAEFREPSVAGTLPAEAPLEGFQAHVATEHELHDGEEPSTLETEEFRARHFDGHPDQGSQASLTGGPSIEQEQAAAESEAGSAADKDKRLAQGVDKNEPNGTD